MPARGVLPGTRWSWILTGSRYRARRDRQNFRRRNGREASDIPRRLATLRRVMRPATPWWHERGQLSQRLRVGSHLAGRRQARRLSRRFARVGVSTSPDRIRQMLAGSTVACAEVVDFNFGLIATQLRRDEFNAKVRRMKRRGTRSLLFLGMVLVTLNFLFCMAYALFSLTLEASPL
jgi:hypothetical protein